jgi:hypothetical protein
MDEPERAAAWEELYDAPPDGWAVTGPQWREDDNLGGVYARRLSGPWRGRDGARQAFGATQVIALRALAQQFRNQRT